MLIEYVLMFSVLKKMYLGIQWYIYAVSRDPDICVLFAYPDICVVNADLDVCVCVINSQYYTLFSLSLY